MRTESDIKVEMTQLEDELRKAQQKAGLFALHVFMPVLKDVEIFEVSTYKKSKYTNFDTHNIDLWMTKEDKDHGDETAIRWYVRKGKK